MLIIDKSGSNTAPFKHLFVDGKGELFRFALCNSFSFASNLVQFARETSPNHKLDLWDQAVQYKLAKTARLERLFIDGVSLHLEKESNHEVWQYGISVTESQRRGQRLWILPDGLIKTSEQVIALEFDHGDNLGKWASQLIKAVRSCASSHIAGVLYCFCLEKNLHPSGYLLDPNDDFTGEFQSLLNANLSGKSLGIITIPPSEWQSPPNKGEFVDFFESAYVFNKKMSLRSQKVAQQILTELRKEL